MAANVVNFSSILSVAAGTVFVRLIYENLNTAAGTFALFTTFFLNWFVWAWNTAKVFEFYLTYGNHKQLGNAILFDGEWQWNSILFDQHFAVCSELNFGQNAKFSSSICREMQLLDLLLRWVWFLASISRYQLLSVCSVSFIVTSDGSERYFIHRENCPMKIRKK